MLIAGIHNTGYNSAAALVKDGQLVFAAQEERFSRQKHDRNFPHRALNAGLKHIGATIDEISDIAIGWNPGITVNERYRAGFSQWPGYPGERLYSNANQILPLLGKDDLVATLQAFVYGDEKAVNFHHYNHHACHAINACSLSWFETAGVLSLDGYGEQETALWGHWNSAKKSIIRNHVLEFPQSIGMVWASLTEYLGFTPEMDEWKVMGMAAYGDWEPYYVPLRGIIRFDDRGEVDLDLRFFNFYNFDQRSYTTHKMDAVLGGQRAPGAAIEKRHFDIAAALQRITEEYLINAATELQRSTEETNICLTGGVALNCVAIGKLVAKMPKINFYVPHAPDDAGNAIGAALAAQFQFDGEYPIQPAHPYLGPEYDCSTSLDAYALASKPLDLDEVVTMLDEGFVIGWYQGRMEFGQRALGNRSILADPRNRMAKQRINESVKYREEFRPFAPAVTFAAAKQYFEMPDNVVHVPYMEMALPVREAYREELPSIVHMDGTARLQTVSQGDNPLFHDLLSRFGQATGHPVLLNTSFNLAGEPIVCTPEDAIRTFYTSGLDALVLGDKVLCK